MRHATVGVCWLLCLGSACLDLQELELDRCGNGVLEVGEDCDSYAEAPGGERCIAAGLSGQCRYSCAVEDGVPLRCPDGYGCGSDGICRRHSGQNGAVISTGQTAGAWIGAGDVDGDGNDDVVNLFTTKLTVDYLEKGQRRESFNLPMEAKGLPVVALLDGDRLADVAVPTDLGLAVWRGTSTRSLRPTTYASLPVQLSDFEFVPIDVVPEVPNLVPLQAFPGDEPLTLTNAGAFPLGGTLTYGVRPGANRLGFSFDVHSFRGPPIAARFDETEDVHGAYTESPEQILLAVVPPNEVRLVRPSYFLADDGEGPSVHYFVDAPSEASGDDPVVPGTHPSFTTITPPAGVTITLAPIATHINIDVGAGLSALPCPSNEHAIADRHLDLVIVGEDADGHVRIAAAFGLGDGSFTSDPCQLDEIAAMTASVDNAAAVPALWAPCNDRPLAAGDMDGDGGLDLVTKAAVHLSGRIPPALRDTIGVCDDITAVPRSGDGEWTAAVLGDVNDDDGLDVIAASDTSGIDVLTSAPGSHLTFTRLATPGPAAGLSVGDFDGNGSADVAFAEIHEGVEDSLYLMFGRAGAPPLAPVLSGGLPDIMRIVSLDLAAQGAPATDAVTDLIVGTRDPTNELVLKFAVLFGRTDQQLQAPFVFAVDPSAKTSQFATERYAPSAVTAGDFGLGCEPAMAEDAGRALFITGIAGGEQVLPYLPPETLLGAACIGRNAELDPIGLEESELPGAAGAKERVARSALAAVRLGGVVQPVIGAWEDDFAGGKVALHLAVPEASGEGDTLVWSLGELATLEDTVPAGTARPTNGSRAWDWASKVSNVGLSCRLTAPADGAPPDESLVFLAARLDGECPDARLRARIAVHVIPAAVLEAVRGGTTSLDGSAEISGTEEQTILGVACMNADADAAEELAILTLDGPDGQCGSDSLSGQTVSVYIVQADADGKLLPDWTLYATLDQNQLPLLESAGDAIPPASGLARGDFDGDGVDDLVVGATPASQVLLGKPVNR